MRRFILSATLLIAFCSAAFPQRKSDLEREGLSGPVRAVSAEKVDYADGSDESKSEIRRKPLDVITFNTNGYQTKRVIYDDYGFLVGTQTYAYDALGRLTEELLNDEENSPLAKDVYSYDADSKLATKLSYEGTSPRALKQTYVYDSRGKMIDEVLSYLNKPAGKTAFKYDERGRLSEVVFYTSKGERGVASVGPCFGAHRLVYKYDGRGRIVEVQAFEPDNSLKRKTTYSYDDRGNVLEESRADSSSSTVFIHSYEFDSHSNWVKRKTRVLFKSKLSLPNDDPAGHERVQAVYRTITYY
jgi:YD repeat-containing protein